MRPDREVQRRRDHDARCRSDRRAGRRGCRVAVHGPLEREVRGRGTTRGRSVVEVVRHALKDERVRAELGPAKTRRDDRHAGRLLRRGIGDPPVGVQERVPSAVGHGRIHHGVPTCPVQRHRHVERDLVAVHVPGDTRCDRLVLALAEGIEVRREVRGIRIVVGRRQAQLRLVLRRRSNPDVEVAARV